MFFHSHTPLILDRSFIRSVIRAALREDGAYRDVTTSTFVSADRRASGVIIAKEAGILAGLTLAEAVFRELDPLFEARLLFRDGDHVRAGAVLMRFSGKARAILSGERTALNFLQHLSGIATLTARFVEALKGTKTKLLDTRKTIPGMRLLAKYAVEKGGGTNHRLDLSDMALVKDNHLVLAADKLENEVRLIRRKYPNHLVEVEAHSLKAVQQLVTLPIDMIMLDNMHLRDIRKAMRIIRKKSPRLMVEASGNVSLKTIRAIARCGVDYISVGLITHSPRALDVSLQLKA